VFGASLRTTARRHDHITSHHAFILLFDPEMPWD
jgi:hypothetical protein